MSIIDANGFGAQDATGMDLWLVLSGSNAHVEADLPANTHATRSMRNISFNVASTFWRPWRGPSGSALEPSSTRVRIHARWKIDLTDFAVNHHIGTARNGVEQISASLDSISRYTIRVAGAIKATGTIPQGLWVWNRLILDIDQQTGGLVRCLASDGVTILATYTLTGPDIAALAGKPNGFWVSTGNDDANFTDFVAQDPSDAIGSVSVADIGAVSVLPVSPIGNSATDIGGTGSYIGIDEIPFNDSDGVVFSGTGLRYGSTMPALPAGHVPLAIVSTYRMVRTGSVAGVNHQHTIRDAGGVLDGGVVPTPGSGFTRRVFSLDRSGSVWTKTAYDATEIGIITVV